MRKLKITEWVGLLILGFIGFFIAWPIISTMILGDDPPAPTNAELIAAEQEKETDN